MGLLCFLLNSALFWIPVGLLTFGREARDQVLILVASFAYFVSFSFIFKSLFEESLVLSFVPWLALGLLWWRNLMGKIFFFVAASAILLTKSQAILFFPFLIAGLLLWTRDSSSWPKAFVIAVLSVFCIASFQRATFLDLNSANEFNRTFNGLTWSTARVENWPGEVYREKRAYLGANKDEHDLSTHAIFPDSVRAYAGMTFFQEETLFLREAPESEEAAAVNGFLQSNSYPSLLWSTPALLLDVLRSSLLFGVMSRLDLLDYRVSTADDPSAIEALSSTLSRNFIWVLGALGAVLVLHRKLISTLLLLAFLVASPILVVMADGYVEFERHLLTQVMFSLFFPLISVGDRNRAVI